VTVEEGKPRVARVEAQLTPAAGDALLLTRSAEDTGLFHGWATFLHEIEVIDEAGENVPVEYEPGGTLRLGRSVTGPVTARYTMLLQHDRFPNQPGSDELAWAHEDAALWTGRALFLEGDPANGIEVSFTLPEGWRATTPWEVLEAGQRFRAEDTDRLLDSAFIAGAHFEAFLGEGADAQVRIALSGENARSAADLVVGNVERYLETFSGVFSRPPEDRLLLVAGDSSFWGGGVMGTTISMVLGSALDEDTLPILRFVTIHELFHLWNANFPYAGDGGVESLYWLSEGTATYYALRGQLGHADLPEEAILGSLAEEIGKYLAARGELTLVSAGPEKLDHYNLIYSGGLMASMLLDITIRRDSAGEFSLDDVMRALGSDEASDLGPIDAAHLAAIVERITGVDPSELLDRYVLGGEELPIEKLLAEIGLKVRLSEEDGAPHARVERDPEASEAALELWQDWALR
jgi:predicted metalloprotease with PDZ domain